MMRMAAGRRVAACFTLLALLCTTFASSVHTADDDAGHVIVGTHDASAHVFTEAPDASATPIHCLACHAARSFRPADDAAAAAAPIAVPTPPKCADVDATCATARYSQPPLRSPPIAPTHV
jgi:hypothetical protein